MILFADDTNTVSDKVVRHSLAYTERLSVFVCYVELQCSSLAHPVGLY